MFELFHPDIVKKLTDLEWFMNCIGEQYRQVAEQYECFPVMSDDRLIQTYDVFWNDVDRGLRENLPSNTEYDDDEERSLDQFKTASYLCFWLRRINPIKEVRFLGTLGARERWINGLDRLPDHSEKFMLYGNEMCAIMIAVRMSQYLSLVELAQMPEVKVLETKVPLDKRRFLTVDQLVDFAMIMKHKNMSAHSLNMTLKMMARYNIQEG